MIKLVFKPIPKLAIGCYLLGLIGILISLFNYFSPTPFLDKVTMLQVFLAGAIVVAIGSVINSLYQFKRPKDDND